MDPSRLPHLRKMRAVLRQNLDRLEEQRAAYGELSVPLAVLNEEERQRKVLAQIESAIVLLEPPPEIGLVQVIPPDAGDASVILSQAMQELRQEVVQFRRQTHVVTLGLGQRTIALEDDLRRQLTAVHHAIADAEASALRLSTDTRAIVESELVQLAEAFKAATAEREAWQQQETAERRQHQVRRLRWQQGLAVLVAVLIVVVFVVGRELAR